LLDYHIRAMNRLFYFVSREACRWVKWICIRERVLFQERARIDGPVVLAVTHISHLEPVFVSLHYRRPIRWMTRIEFYRPWWRAMLFQQCGAFCIDRFGFQLPGVRNSIRLLQSGHTVGVFPEGGVKTGRESVMRGGTIKRGVGTIAVRTGAPILPVIVIGTEKLNQVWPWIPAKRGEALVAFGEPIMPPPRPHRMHNRRVRAEVADQVRAAFVNLYQELLDAELIRDADVP
jgi:1-acyl-sn-glycerol-3-phosphate acyltransferase